MSVKVSRHCIRPSSQKASAKAMNRPSRVRVQKRRKKRPATRNPITIAPERKSNSIALLLFVPDESEQQHADRAQRKQQSRQPEIAAGKEEQVDHDREIVEREQAEAERAPQQQPRPRPPVIARQQQRAGAARDEAEQIDGSREIM